MANKKVNPETGEVTQVIEYRESAGPLAVPDMQTVNTVQQVAGKNPLGVNLKDHPEFDGQKFMCVRARITSSAEGNQFIIATGFVFPEGVKPTVEDHAVTLITGAGNVFERVVIAMEQNAFPIVGKFRRGGRAWFLD